MSQSLLKPLTGRTAINLGNLVLILLLVHGIWQVLGNYGHIAGMQDEMEEILEGLGTILVALGVALEERETLLKFIGVYPAGLTPLQARVDHHCHGYGLLLLLVGLFVEVAVYVIRMPNLDTVNFDPGLILAGTAFCVLGALLLARLTWLLWRAPAEAAQAA
ncbi:hypothetical protein [Humidesulfovibrio sp.]